MIIEIVGLIVFIALALIVIGFVWDLPIMGVVGFSLFFIVGLMTFLGEVQYVSGSITNTTEAGVYEVSKVYSDLTGARSHWVGVLLAAISVIGFIIVFTTKDNELGYG